MKKVIILVTSAIVIGVGLIIYLLSYQYDKVHFGEDFLVYADSSTMWVPMTVECDGKTTLIAPDNRYNIYDIIVRGTGVRKKHLFETTTKGRTMTVRFSDTVTFTLYDDPEEHDRVYFTYDNNGSRKYYSVDGLAMFDNMLAAASEDNYNYLIEEELTEAEAEKDKSFAKEFMDSIYLEGAYLSLQKYATPEYVSLYDDVDSKNDLKNFTKKIRGYGTLQSVDNFRCYTTHSNGGAKVMTGVLTYADSWKSIFLFINEEGKIMEFGMY